MPAHFARYELEGGALFVFTNGAIAYASWVTAHRWLMESRLRVRLVATGVLGTAAVILLAEGLSPLGWYTRGAVALAAFLIAVVTHVMWGAAADARSDLAVVRTTLTAVTGSRGAVLVILCGTATALAAWRALAHPPLGWDSLTYHLVFAGKYVQSAGLVAFDGPSAMDHYAHFPRNAEIMASWFMLPFSSDLLVGWMNFALLGLGWLATYGVGRELGLRSGAAALTATAVCSSPFLFSFATTQNADTLVFAALMSAALFAVRYAERGQATDAALACAAAGIAIGAKYTAVLMSGLILAGIIITAVVRARRMHAWPPVVRLAIIATILVAALGMRQYVLNAVSTGNPVYPLTIHIAGRELLPGSPYTAQLVEDKGPGSRGQDALQLVRTLSYFPDWRTPTSAGPKYLLLIPLALLGVLRSDSRRPWLGRLLVLLALVGIAAAYAPATGLPALSRRFWPGSAARFLATPFALLAVTGVAAAQRWPTRRRHGLYALIVGFICWDLLMADTTIVGNVPLIVGGAAAIGVAIASRRRIAVPATSPWLSTAVLAALGLLAIPLLHSRRAESRWRYFATAQDAAPIPRDYVRGWEYCDHLASPATIALAGGWSEAGQNYFFYPLMGSRLQNRVTYVPLNDAAAPGSREYVRRLNGRFAEWLAGLRARRVDLVFIQAPWPVEDGWMRAHPVLFTVVSEGTGYRIYSLRAPPGKRSGTPKV